MSKGDYLNYSQLRHFILKYSKKTVYYNTYKNKMESRTTSKNKEKRKEKAEEKKISNAITDEIATIQYVKIWSLLEDKEKIDINVYT